MHELTCLQATSESGLTDNVAIAHGLDLHHHVMLHKVVEHREEPGGTSNHNNSYRSLDLWGEFCFSEFIQGEMRATESPIAPLFPLIKFRMPFSLVQEGHDGLKKMSPTNKDDIGVMVISTYAASHG